MGIAKYGVLTNVQLTNDAGGVPMLVACDRLPTIVGNDINKLETAVLEQLDSEFASIDCNHPYTRYTINKGNGKDGMEIIGVVMDAIDGAGFNYTTAVALIVKDPDIFIAD